MLLAIPLNAVDELDEPDEFDRSEVVHALTRAYGHEHGYDDEPAPDTFIVPIVGDRVRYSRGSGHLVGLEGSVVTDDDGPDLPRGLRSVLLDGEAWPVVVPVMSLDRAVSQPTKR